MQRFQHSRCFFALVLGASLFTSLTTSLYAASITPPEPSAHELIASGQYRLAAEVLLRAIRQNRIPGQDNQDTAALLSSLGLVYDKLGRYVEAEAALEKSARMFRDFGDTAGRNYARTLNNLANVHLNRKRYAKAVKMFSDVLAIYRNGTEDNAGDIALVLNNLGLATLSQQQYVRAEQLFRESLELHPKTREAMPERAATLNNLALLCRLRNRLQEAAGLYSQAIDIWRESALIPRPEVAVGLHNLATLENVLGHHARSEEHFKDALAIVEASFPAEHPTRTSIMTGYADLLLKVGRKREAKQLLAGVRTLQAKHDHENFQNLSVNVRDLAR